MPPPAPAIHAKRLSGRPPLHRVSLVQRAKARTLYLVEQLTAKEICAQTGIPANQLKNIIHRETWSSAKHRLKASVVAQATARTKERVEEIYDSVALQTESLALGTFSEAQRRLSDGGDMMPRDLQALSQAGKNFVFVARQARGLDAEANARSGNGNTLIFIGALDRVEAAKPKERNVTPATLIDLPEAPRALPEAVNAQPALAAGSTVEENATTPKELVAGEAKPA